MKKYRKKPVEIEAVQYTGSRNISGNAAEILEWVGESAHISADGLMLIQTQEGTMIANQYDWIIKGVAGEFYPCKHKIFEATYEKVVGS